jgi:hypothetical protein
VKNKKEIIIFFVHVSNITSRFYAPLKNIMGGLNIGQSWSGRFPFKKDGELAGFITVSSDATLYNSKGSENLRTCQDHARGSNLKRIQWHPRPPIVPVPQIASSVSNLVHYYNSFNFFPPIFVVTIV